MPKLLVEVFVPVAGRAFDMFIPAHLMLYDALRLMNKMVAELSGGLFVPDGETTLCDRQTGAILNINLSVAELNLQNGSKLMLM